MSRTMVMSSPISPKSTSHEEGWTVSEFVRKAISLHAARRQAGNPTRGLTWAKPAAGPPRSKRWVPVCLLSSYAEKFPNKRTKVTQRNPLNSSSCMLLRPFAMFGSSLGGRHSISKNHTTELDCNPTVSLRDSCTVK